MIGLRVLLLVAVCNVAAWGDSQLLCFSAAWCKPCHEMKPVLEELARQGYPLRGIDVEQNGDVAKRFGVESVPSFVLIDGNSRILDRIDQATTGQNLIGMLNHYGVKPRGATIRGQSPDPLEVTEPTSLRTASSSSNLQAAAARESSFNSSLGSGPSASQSSLDATVRLKVVDDGGHSFGTGTVIDVHGKEALVLTCGHIFRTSKGKGRIQIDRFAQPGSSSLEGSLIGYDMDLDVALVSVTMTEPIAIAPLASLDYRAQKGEAVYSVGCSRGAPPTVMHGKVNQIDKYLGPPNITASGQPVDGRSGGGLFNQRGELIGVCSAADPEFDEGLYGALPRIYYELDRNGLSFVYDKSKLDQSRSVGVTGVTPVVPVSTGSPAEFVPQTPTSVSSGGVARGAGDTEELVCVLKRDGTDEPRVFVIENPSVVLLEYLEREAKKSASIARKTGRALTK